MSEGLRKTFPRAHFIPFNPLFPQKLAKAKANADIDMIIVDSSLPTLDDLQREPWVVANTVIPVLEVGCQSGIIYRQFDPQRQADWYGLDLDVWMLNNFCQGDCHKLPYKTDSFKTVAFCEIAEHVEDPVQGLVEAMRVASERVLITMPYEYFWGEGALPFMSSDAKDEFDHITRRQQIDKNTRWLQGCLNPKDYVASWDEELYEHLWHHRHFYHPEDVGGVIETIPCGKTDRAEVNVVEYLDEATRIYDEKYNPVHTVSENWHYEKLKYLIGQTQWAFHCIIILLNGLPYMSGHEFQKYFDSDEEFYGQIMSGENRNLVGFLRRM